MVGNRRDGVRVELRAEVPGARELSLGGVGDIPDFKRLVVRAREEGARVSGEEGEVRYAEIVALCDGLGAWDRGGGLVGVLGVWIAALLKVPELDGCVCAARDEPARRALLIPWPFGFRTDQGSKDVSEHMADCFVHSPIKSLKGECIHTGLMRPDVLILGTIHTQSVGLTGASEAVRHGALMTAIEAEMRRRSE